MNRRSPINLGVNVLISLASVVLLIGGLELAARLIDPFTPFLLIPNESNCMRRSPTYSVEFIPSCTGTLSQTLYTTNSLGMRGPEIRDDGSIRILALGDSCTWGWHVDQDQSYPAVLQKLLDERAGAGKYQVLNAGVPGYTSYQGLTYLREKGLALDPSIVVIAFGWNDATTTGDVESQIALERLFMPFIRMDDLLLKRSKLYRWLRYRSVGERPRLGERVPFRKHTRNLYAMIDTATQRGAHPMLLNFWLKSKPRWRSVIGRIAGARKVPMVEYDGPRFDYIHPTAEGQRMLAEQIAAALEGNGYLR